MRAYELMLIAHPDLEPEAVTDLAQTLTSLITDAGGQINKLGQLADGSGQIVERRDGEWQKRKFAYPINKVNEGYYLVFQAQMNPDVLNALERNLKLNEAVLRYLLVRTDA